MKEEPKYTGSTISLVSSEDGINWVVEERDFVVPTPTASPSTWKQGYAYGFDTIQDPSDPEYILCFYNGR